MRVESVDFGVLALETVIAYTSLLFLLSLSSPPHLRDLYWHCSAMNRETFLF